jgi:P-loop containing dynein motor region D4
MRCLGLINNAIIDWFLPWPEQALLAVATSLLSEDVSTLTFGGNDMNEFFPHKCMSTCIYSLFIRL